MENKICAFVATRHDYSLSRWRPNSHRDDVPVCTDESRISALCQHILFLCFDSVLVLMHFYSQASSVVEFHCISALYNRHLFAEQLKTLRSRVWISSCFKYRMSIYFLHCLNRFPFCYINRSFAVVNKKTLHESHEWTSHLYIVSSLRVSGATPPSLYAFMVC